ncbi:hypothetical protein LSAT2_006567 [Lamellibrachia satsuma]|nr:hypothetical protein LSAT2_006567 [Lamellibrachia satsuma]
MTLDLAIWTIRGTLRERDAKEHTSHDRVRRLVVFLHRLADIGLNGLQHDHPRGCTEAECQSSSTATPNRRRVLGTPPPPPPALALHANPESSHPAVTNCVHRCLASGGAVLECLRLHSHFRRPAGPQAAVGVEALDRHLMYGVSLQTVPERHRPLVPLWQRALWWMNGRH